MSDSQVRVVLIRILRLLLTMLEAPEPERAVVLERAGVDHLITMDV